MGLDTLYRPTTFDDVLGQEGTIRILRQYVSSGAGFHQSYLFSGPFGSGKTTLGRILARALLCSNPVGGNPCDKCNSCKSILENGSSEDFFEIDAATNSGKDNVKRIVEETQYSTFSGKRRIRLFDECHRLSTDALDALLKPLEECVPGSQDKVLVCLFCTTEPEKMRATILSRCAPAFIIQPVPPSTIAERLLKICKSEGIPADLEALVLIAELTECHIRDALKAVEGVSMMGPVNVENVSKYLHLDRSRVVLEILSSIRTDSPKALKLAGDLLSTMSPLTIYEKLADMAMLAYRTSLGAVSPPAYLDSQLIKTVGTEVGGDLLTYVERFSSRPSRPTAAMVMCDLARLQHGPPVQNFSPPVITPARKSEHVGKVEEKPQTVDGVHVHPRAVNSRNEVQKVTPALSRDLSPREFLRLVKMRVDEMDEHGQTRRTDMGDARTDPSG